LAEFVHFCK